jgi:hypothetical protein
MHVRLDAIWKLFPFTVQTYYQKLIIYVLPFKYVFHCVDSPIKTWTQGVENKIQKLQALFLQIINTYKLANSKINKITTWSEVW